MAARKRGQAAAGEVTQGQAASYEHGEDAAAEVAADLSDGIKKMVAVNLLPSIIWGLEYSKASFPTINNVGILAAEAQFWSLSDERMRHILEDVSAPTPVERGDASTAQRCWQRSSTRASDHALSSRVRAKVIGPTGRVSSRGQSRTTK